MGVLSLSKSCGNAWTHLETPTQRRTTSTTTSRACIRTLSVLISENRDRSVYVIDYHFVQHVYNEARAAGSNMHSDRQREDRTGIFPRSLILGFPVGEDNSSNFFHVYKASIPRGGLRTLVQAQFYAVSRMDSRLQGVRVGKKRQRGTER